MAKKTYTPDEYKAKLQKKKNKNKKFFDTLVKTTAILAGCALTFSATVIAEKRVKGTPVSAAGGEVTVTEEEKQTKIDWEEVEKPTSGDSQDNDKTDDKNDGNNNQQEEEKSPVATKKGQYEYFVKSFNNVKKNAKSATLYQKEGSNYKGVAEAGSFSWLLSSLMNSLLKPEEPNETYSGEELTAKFPPAGATCNLKTDDIVSIECKDDGDYYIITIVCADEKNPTTGNGVGAVASPITKQQIMDPISNVPGLKNLNPSCAYENVKCEAKIEKATGNMVHYYFDLPLILSFEKQSFRVGLEFQEWWNIEY